jgi:WD40 repeat protein
LTVVRSSRRPGYLIGSCILLVAGCSSSSDPDVANVADTATGAESADDVTGAVAEGVVASPIARWGSGRAMLARYDPVGKRTAVVTTVGAALHGDDGTVTPIAGDLVERASLLEMTADGRLLAIAGESSGSVTVWDLALGQALGAPFAAGGQIAGLEFVPDGSAVVVSTAAAVTRVPLDGSAPVVLVDAAQGSLGRAAIAPDGSWIIVPVATADVVRIALWRAEGTSFVDLPAAEGVNAREVFASPSGSRVGVISADAADPFQARLAIWDIVSGTVTGTIQLVDGTPGSRWAFGSDDRVLVADGPATTLWSPAGEQMLTLDLAADVPVQSVFGISDGRFITVLQDGTIDVWDRDGGRVATLGIAGTTLVDVAVAPDGNTVTTVDFFGSVQRWDIAAASLSSTPPTLVVDGVGLINSVAFAPDGSSVAVATSNGRVETLDDNGGIIRSFAQPSGNVDSVAFSPDSTAVASALGERLGPESFDDTVTIFDATSGGESGQFGGEAEQVSGCAFFRNEVRFSPKGDVLAANSHDFTVSLYDATSGDILHTFPAHGSTVTDLAFSPNGDLLVTTSDDSTLRIWSVADHALVNEFTTPPGGYWSLVFGGDDRTLVVSDLVGTVSVIDIETGAAVRTFAGQKNRLAELAISPDGSLVASGADDNTVEIWSTATGELLAQLPGHTAPVRTVAFSADGTMLASGSGDATVRLWALQT